MRIIFMGTPDFAVPVFEELIRAGQEVVLAVTQPDRRSGRGKESTPPPVKRAAIAASVPVYQPEKVRTDEAYEQLKAYQPDLIVVAAFGQILPQRVLDLPRLGCVNVHASLLPKYRGAAPIQWAVINGEKESGVTIMQMDAGLDTGDILMQESIPLDPEETGESLYEKLSAMGGKLLIRALPAIEDGTIERTAQTDEESSYAGMLKKEMGLIDFSRPADELERLVRGLNSWPSAYTYHGGKQLKIWRAAVGPGTGGAVPGQIVKVTKNEVSVACGEGSLVLLEVQAEGRKRMETAQFLLGNALREGEMLGQ